MAEPALREDPPESLRDGLAALHADAFGWALALARGDRAEAEDLLHTAYLRILDGTARFGGRSALKTWVFGVVRRVAQERRRRGALRRLLRGCWLAPAEADATPGPAERAERTERAERLRRALARLPARQREVLHLCFYQELTIAQAAAVAGIAAGTARTHYERGKARLRELLREEAT